MSAKTRALYAVHCERQGKPAPERWTPAQMRSVSTLPPPAELPADLDAKAARLDQTIAQLQAQAADLRAAAQALRNPR